MNRNTTVAGRFYEADFGKLHKQIEDCFYIGPGDLPVSSRNKKIYGIIVPHAGYSFSGKCSAWAYKELGEAKIPSTYLIIGTNHTGFTDSKIATLDQDWSMPFGIVKYDKSLVMNLEQKSNHAIRVDIKAHFNEHSVEVQLPFLQFVNKDYLRKLKIVPLIVNYPDFEFLHEMAKVIAESSQKDLVVIGSSDFTHYGNNYDYVPFFKDVKEGIYSMDQRAIELILRMDAKGFLEYASDKTICGAGAIALTIETVKELGATRGKLVCYYTSGEISKDYSNAVGYGAIVFE